MELVLEVRRNNFESGGIAFWDGISRDNRKREVWVWLPRSQVNWLDGDPTQEDGAVTVEIPEWLAMEKGLI